MTEGAPLIVFGAGGHGAVVIEIVESARAYRIVGVADDDAARCDGELLGYTVGPLESFRTEWPVVVAVGDNTMRAAVADRLGALDRLVAAPLAHARATVSRRALLGPGTVVMAGAVINARARVGQHAIVNTGATVDHDCVIGDLVHIAPGAQLAGGITVGPASQIGVGASVAPGCRIGAGTVVGAGSVVLRDLPDRVVAFGNPARIVRDR